MTSTAMSAPTTTAVPNEIASEEEPVCRIHEEGVLDAATGAIQTGVFAGTTRDLFTTA